MFHTFLLKAHFSNDDSICVPGVISPADAIKKWKSLKDTYWRIMADERKHQGEQITHKSQWQYYDEMEFMREQYIYRT